jgi:hypothetical protein
VEVIPHLPATVQEQPVAAVSLDESRNDPPADCSYDELLAFGRKLLGGHQYGAARRTLRRCLESVPGCGAPVDPPRRGNAFLLLTVATLARTRPDHRRLDEIVAMTGYLIAGAVDPLAPALAALLRDDTDAGGIREDPDLRRLAGTARFDELTTEQVRFLAAHLVPSDGEAWRRLRSRARRDGIRLEPYTEAGGQPPTDGRRQRLVPRYFTPDPVLPEPVHTGLGVVLGCFATASLIASWVAVDIGVRRSGTSPAGGARAVGLGLLLLGLAALLFIGAVHAHTRYRTYQHKLDRYATDWARANPKPSDAQVDGWLLDDIGRIETLGAARHSLSRKLRSQGGSLAARPQTIVGLSTRTRLVRRPVIVNDLGSPTGLATVIRDIRLPVARIRTGADGRLRADNYRVITVYLTADRVCLFDVELELATGRIVQERRLSFWYRDIVGIEVANVPAGLERSDQVKEQLRRFLGDRGGSPRAVENQRFTLSIVDGRKVRMDIGVGFVVDGRREAHAIAWQGNRSFLATVDRLVWERRDENDRYAG